MWGCENFGIAWRYDSEKPRFVGAVGVDLEYVERGFKMGWTYTSEWVGDGDEKKDDEDDTDQQDDGQDDLLHSIQFLSCGSSTNVCNMIISSTVYFLLHYVLLFLAF